MKIRGKVAEGKPQDTVTNEINSNEKSDQMIEPPKSSRNLSLIQSLCEKENSDDKRIYQRFAAEDL